jgi:hypothetical protein
VSVEGHGKQETGSWEALKLQLMDEQVKGLVALQANNRVSSTVARVL